MNYQWLFCYKKCKIKVRKLDIRIGEFYEESK